MRDQEFHRHMISHRAAVKVLEEINKALRNDDMTYFWGYSRGEAGEYDQSVYAMAREVQRLRAEVDEYRRLKAALQPIVKALV